jgi:hypothetical protein
MPREDGIHDSMMEAQISLGGCDDVAAPDTRTEAATRLDPPNGGWSGPSGSSVCLLARGPCMCCVHAQLHNSGDRRLTKEEQHYHNALHDGEAMVAEDGRLPSRSVAVFG